MFAFMFMYVSTLLDLIHRARGVNEKHARKQKELHIHVQRFI